MFKFERFHEPEGKGIGFYLRVFHYGIFLTRYYFNGGYSRFIQISKGDSEKDPVGFKNLYSKTFGRVNEYH